jgi:hypothetical protein
MRVAQHSDVDVRPRGRRCKDVADANRVLADAIAHLHRRDGPPACMPHLWQPGQGRATHTSRVGSCPGPDPFF